MEDKQHRHHPKHCRDYPDWLRDLPKGLHSLNDIVRLSGKSKQTISRVIQYFGLLYHYELKDGKMQMFLRWKGIK